MTAASLHRTDLLIGSALVPAQSEERIEVISPFTEEVIGSIPRVAEAEADEAMRQARRAFDDGPWPRMAPAERGRALLRLADALAERKDESALLYTLETGVPIGTSPALGLVTDIILRAYAEMAIAGGFTERRQWLGSDLTVRQEPVGVALGISPWNAPVPGISFMLGPALAAGCPIVIKPAAEAPLSPRVLAEAVVAADLPPGVVSILPGDRDLGAYLVEHPEVDKIAFTGSTAVGASIMASAARRMVRVTLELGGKGPAIVCDDADLDALAGTLVRAGMGNSGQVCSAQTRILVPRSRHDEFVERIVAEAAALKVGDPMDPETDLGPLTMERQRTRVEDYLEIGRREGAKILLGGGRPAGLDRGWFIEPTIFGDVDPAMRIAQEEIFGPVLCVLTYTDDDDAVKIANDSAYGLVGSVFTTDPERADRIASRMRVGQVHVNGYGTCPGQPFGGFKRSGIGRKGGPEGLAAYQETKVVQRHR
ncbi:aldehyde dehydrogenase [Actinomadura vinacea]|uniref:aldehyde dehydrogenase n=1 Tax=Actinomadura vinacea TaxID=115336 RepID=UPI0031DBBCA6